MGTEVAEVGPVVVPEGRDYAAAKDAEVGKKTNEKRITNIEQGMSNFEGRYSACRELFCRTACRELFMSNGLFLKNG